MKRYLIEFIGTFFLTLSIARTGNPWAIGAMLIAIMYMVGVRAFGGHYNPAVSFAKWVDSGFKREEFLIMMIAQLIGAFVALALLFKMFGTPWIPGSMGGGNWWIVLCTEAIFTYLFVMVFITMCTLHELKGAHVYGLAIGFTYAAVLAFGGLYNPAVALGAVLLCLATGGSAKVGALALAYVVGPFIGGLLAASGYEYFCEGKKVK